MPVMMWTQNYDPLGSPVLSTLLAATPIVALLGTLALLKWSAPRAAGTGLALALAISILAYGMPVDAALAAAGFGAAFGMFPAGTLFFTVEGITLAG